MSDRGSEPAYPVDDENINLARPEDRRYAGMTIREKMVMAAMRGICAYEGGPPFDLGATGPWAKETAAQSIAMADALLAALAESEKGDG